MAVASSIAMLVLGVDLRTGILMAAMVSSTDAAAVFAILRRLPLRSKVRTTLEGESGFNDPPAIIIVTVVVSDAWNQMSVTGMLANGLFQLTAGALIGAAVAMVGQAFLHRISLPSAGLYLRSAADRQITAILGKPLSQHEEGCFPNGPVDHEAAPIPREDCRRTDSL